MRGKKEKERKKNGREFCTGLYNAKIHTVLYKFVKNKDLYRIVDTVYQSSATTRFFPQHSHWQMSEDSHKCITKRNVFNRE
jgi:hypothetical protein